MAEDQKAKFDVPWAALLALIAALAGIVAQRPKPLVSERPPPPGEKLIGVAAGQDIDARWWQDPLAVAQKQKVLLDSDLTSGRAPPNRAQRHGIDALVELLRLRATTIHGRVLLLGVMLDAGSFSEHAESRLRARQAVLEGLGESGFVPIDAEHIGFVTMPSVAPDGKILEDTTLLAFEECRAGGDSKEDFPLGTERVFVLWLPSAKFNPPLRSFATLIAPFKEISDKLDVKLIGPANSIDLAKMVGEARFVGLSDATQRALDGVSIISPVVTTSDSALVGSSAPYSVQENIEGSVTRGPRGGLSFRRTISTDDVALDALINELKLRQVYVPRDHVVILTEWDNPYQSRLVADFEAAVRREQKLTEPKNVERPTRRIISYRYLHGIDGRLPGDTARQEPRTDSPKDESSSEATPADVPQGSNQSDFLRRLALQLKDLDEKWRRQKGRGILAVGLLGSDIYDKLMILRALRPEFPDAVFFTNSFDAYFEQRNHWDDAHNLVIVSTFGNVLPGKWQQQATPFRDNYQTSMYASTLAATGRITLDDIQGLAKHPRIFEIGRKGAYELQPALNLSTGFAKGDPYWFRHWLNSPRVRFGIPLAGFAFLIVVTWITISIADPRRPGGGTLGDRVKRLLVNTPFWLICGVPMIVLSVALFAQTGGAALEPLAFFSGISIWPSEMLRLIALLLAIHFMIKASFDLHANAKKIEEEFSFAPLPLTPFRWRDLGIGFEHWQTKEPPRTSRFSAQEAWHAYLVRNKFWPRYIRIGALFTISFFFSFAISRFFRSYHPPVRGEIAAHFDQLVSFASYVGTIILSCYVADAILLANNFISMFTRSVTKWEPELAKRSGRLLPLNEEELSKYRDVLFVAQRTEVFARLIWYPIIVVTLIFISRSSVFDNWAWPVSLVLTLALIAIFAAIGGAMLLHRSAERLRDVAVGNLQLLRLRSYSAKEKRQMLEEMIMQISNLKKGAFAPLTDQPFVRAVLFNSGTVGLLAVVQRLLESF
jgi:hypothetical protein